MAHQGPAHTVQDVSRLDLPTVLKEVLKSTRLAEPRAHDGVTLKASRVGALEPAMYCIHCIHL